MHRAYRAKMVDEPLVPVRQTDGLMPIRRSVYPSRWGAGACPDVGALGAHRLRHEPQAQQQRKELAADADGESGLQRRKDADDPDEAIGGRGALEAPRQ